MVVVVVIAKKVEKEVLLETRQRVRLRPERDRVRETVARPRVVLLRERRKSPTRMGSIGNGVRLRALVHLRRVGRSVCEKIQSVHRIWRGARYGDRSIGDDWTVDHPVEHVSRRAIRVHLVNILRHFLALTANALATGHR